MFNFLFIICNNIITLQLLLTNNIFAMPLFGINVPKPAHIIRGRINKEKLIGYKKPIGLIGESLDFAYGYDGESYYVEIGSLGYLAFGRMRLTFEEAKASYDAMLFFDIDVWNWDYDAAKRIIRQARKTKLSGDNLMFFLGQEFENFN